MHNPKQTTVLAEMTGLGRSAQMQELGRLKMAWKLGQDERPDEAPQ